MTRVRAGNQGLKANVMLILSDGQREPPDVCERQPCRGVAHVSAPDIPPCRESSALWRLLACYGEGRGEP